MEQWEEWEQPSELLKVTAVNVTSLHRHLDTVLTAGWDVIGVSETKVAEPDIRSIEGRIHAAGYEVVWGVPPPLVQSGAGLAAQQRGVAVLVRRPIVATEEPVPEQLLPWVQEARCVNTRITLASGHSLICIVAYGSANKEQDAEALVQDVLEYVNETSDSWIFVGDFNLEVEHSPVLTGALNMNRAFSPLIGVHGPDHACTCTRGAGTRIDHVLLSQDLSRVVSDAYVDVESHFPSHRAVVTALAVGAPQSYEMVCLPNAIPDDILAVLPRCPHQDPAEVLMARVEQGALHDAYRMWCQRWEAHLLRLARDHGGRMTRYHEGRGGEHVIQHRPLQCKARAERRRPLEVRRLDRLVCALVSACMQCESGDFLCPEDEHEVCRLWRLVDGPEQDLLTQDYRSLYDQAHRWLEDARARDNKEKREKWLKRCDRLLDPRCSQSFAYIKGARQQVAACMVDRNDDPCLTPDSQLAELALFWNEVAALPGHVDENYQLFDEYLARHMPPGANARWTRPPLCPKALQAAICQARSHAAPGIDGWRVLELRALPHMAFQELACIMAEAERRSWYPETLRLGLTAFLPKAHGQIKAKQFRPITIFSAVWRGYARLRARQLAEWQEGWLHTWQCGARPRRGLLDALGPTTTLIEMSKSGLMGPLFGITYDMEKYFDKIQAEHVRAIWQHQGLEEAELNMVTEVFKGARRRFKLAHGVVGPEFVPVRGIAQGCGFSCAAANAMIAPLLYGLDRVAHEHDGSVHVSSYVDDLIVLADSAELLEAVDAHIKEYVQMVGFKLNAQKCQKFCTRRRHDSEAFARIAYDETRVIDLLKCKIVLDGGDPAILRQDAEMRVQEAQRRLRRLRALPPSFERKSYIAGAGVMSKLTYAPLHEPPPSIRVHHFHRHVRAVLAHKPLHDVGIRQKALEIEFVMFRPGHVHHWAIAAILNLTNIIGKAWEHDPVRTVQMLQCLARQPKRVIHGVYGAFCRWLASMDVRVTHDGMGLSFADLHVPLLPMGPRKEWQHHVREFWRHVLLRRLCLRRPRMTHLSHGIARDDTVALYASLTCHRVRGMTRTWMMDGLFTGDRLARHRMGTAQCPLCEADNETLMHRLWTCPRTEELRLISHDMIRHWPPLTQGWGLRPLSCSHECCPRDALKLAQGQCVLILLGWEAIRDGSSCHDVRAFWTPRIFKSLSWEHVRQLVADTNFGIEAPHPDGLHQPPAENGNGGIHGLPAPDVDPPPPNPRQDDARHEHDLIEDATHVTCRRCFKTRAKARAYSLRTIPCTTQFASLRHEVRDLGEVGGHDVRMAGHPNEGQLCSMRCIRCERRFSWMYRSNFVTFPCKGPKWQKQLSQFDWPGFDIIWDDSGESASAVQCMHCGWQTNWRFKATQCRAHMRRCPGHQ